MLKNEKLTKYTYSRSGDMRGSRYNQEIYQTEDGQVFMKITSADRHDAEEVVEIYEMDPQVLSEIEKIYRKYHMNGWAHRTISNLFICDGASYSYDFTFENMHTRFSSQHYPASYSSKLKQIDDVIEKYTIEK